MIAVCISGQTRSYNNHNEQFHKDMELLFGDFGYHLYGHTWDDQPAPKDRDLFQTVISTNQNDIWENIAKGNNVKHSPNGIFGAMVHDADWLNNPEYQAILDGAGDMQKFMKDIVTGLYSAIVSNWHAMSIVQGNYSGYVKFRWDSAFNCANPEQFDIDVWKETIKTFLSGPSKKQSESSVLANGQMICRADGTVFVNDMMFTFTPDAYQKVVGKNIYDCIREMNNDNLLKVHSHELWTTYLRHRLIDLHSMAHENPIGFNHEPKGQNKSFNKKWNI